VIGLFWRRFFLFGVLARKESGVRGGSESEALGRGVMGGGKISLGLL
jgi:hypothetical protein